MANAEDRKARPGAERAGRTQHARPPALVETGRLFRVGHLIGARCTCGPFEASVTARAVVLSRVVDAFGHSSPSPSLRIDTEQLGELLAACGEWEERRSDWASFVERRFMFETYCDYTRPGPGAPVERVARRGRSGDTRGEWFHGREEEVAHEPPVEVRPRLWLAADVWRRGEAQGSPEGSLVGARYEAYSRLALDARREHARASFPSGGALALAPGDLPDLEEFAAYARTVRRSLAA